MQRFKAANPNNVQYSLTPLYLVTKLFGLSSYSASTEKGRIKLKQSRFWLVYNLWFCCTFFGFYIFVLQDANTSKFDGNHSTDIIDVFNLYGEAVVMVLNILLTTAKRGQIIKAQRCLMRIDGHLKYLGAELNYKKPRYLISGYILVSSCFLVTLEYLRCNTYYQRIPKSDSVCFVLCLIPIFVKNFAHCQFICYVYLLHQRFAQLNSLLKRTQSPKRPLVYNKWKQVAILMATRKLHARLCETGRTINAAFSFQILVMIGSDFIDISTWSYYCYVGFSKLVLEGYGGSSETTVNLALCAAYKLLQIFILSLVCCRTSKEANGTHQIIYKEDILDDSISTEVCFFGEQIAHWRFKFTAFDFFDINMTLVYSVVCAAMTYLLIFIQLDLGN